MTITVRPILRYSPLSIWCEKRPEPSFPASVTPFWLAAFVALAKSKEGLAVVSMPNVLAMPVTFFARLASTHPSLRGRGMFRPRSWGDGMPARGGWASCVALRVKPKQAPGPCPHDPSQWLTSAHHPHSLFLSAVPHKRQNRLTA